MSRRRTTTLLGLFIGLATVGALAQTATAAPARTPATTATAPVARARPACDTPAAGHYRCFAEWTSTAASAAKAGPPAGYTAADIASAYRLTGSGGADQTVAIVDAYDNPRAEADLAVYRRAMGLKPCTTANGCFRKVNQRGGTTPPEGDPGWGVEIALDIQAVSAACPACRILLVEADDSQFTNIGAAVNRAARLGADVISNSYGGDEYGGSAAMARKYYTHPGVAQVASSGDYGFGPASFPAVAPHVVAIGGTRLSRTAGGAWTEKAWAGAGSGCSAWFAKPAWQKDTHCRMRTVADLSAVADPETGFAVYDTYGLGPDNGWIVVGGTSLSAPLIGGMIGRAGNAAALTTAQYVYTHRSGLKDVIGGSNGFCGGDYLCTGLKGYDGPTGWGSPRGLKAL